MGEAPSTKEGADVEIQQAVIITTAKCRCLQTVLLLHAHTVLAHGRFKIRGGRSPQTLAQAGGVQAWQDQVSTAATGCIK